MNTLPKSLLSVAVSVALIATGCSSSTDTTVDVGDNPAIQDPTTSETNPANAGNSPILSIENHAAVLREIIKIANDDVLNAASDSVEPVFGLVENLIDQAILNGTSSGNGLTFVVSEPLTEGGESSEYTFACDSGGTLVARAYKDDSVGGPFIDRLVADGACAIDDAAYEGSVYKAVRFVRSTSVSTFDNFTVSHANGDALLLHGDYADSSTEGRGPRVVTGWTDTNLVLTENGETTRVDNYTSNRVSLVQSVIPGSGAAGATAEVNFTVTAPWTAGEPLDIVVDLAYEDAENSQVNESGAYSGQWQRGSVSVVAADGSALTLSPDTGDAATLSVFINGDVNDPIIYNWIDGFQITCAAGFDCR